MTLWRTLSYYFPCPPILTIIALATAVFAVESGRELSWGNDYGATPLLLFQAWDQLLAGNVDLSVVSTLSTLFTALFLHGDSEHLLLNMVFLWIFGALAARHLGYPRAFFLFFLFGACGNILQALLNPASPIPIIGASGAILGFEGLYLGLAMVWDLEWPDIWPLARPIHPMQLGLFTMMGVGFDITSVMNNAQDGIAYGAHVGGFLCGIGVARIITLLYPTHEEYQMKNPVQP
jgi:membrane associated rhomboid family serine protease